MDAFTCSTNGMHTLCYVCKGTEREGWGVSGAKSHFPAYLCPNPSAIPISLFPVSVIQIISCNLHCVSSPLPMVITAYLQCTSCKTKLFYYDCLKLITRKWNTFFNQCTFEAAYSFFQNSFLFGLEAPQIGAPPFKSPSKHPDKVTQTQGLNMTFISFW